MTQKQCANIVLVGLAGCGKTTVGQALAQKLGWTFLDTDHFITHQTGQAIADIFGQHGEAYFRDLETQVCKTLQGKTHTVIATGGGMILRAENRECLQNLGTVFYLDLSPETIARRLHQDATRPLLSTSVDKATTLKQQLDAREALYKSVSHHVVSADQNVESICCTILDLIPTAWKATRTAQVRTTRDHTYDIVAEFDAQVIQSRISAMNLSQIVVVTHPEIRALYESAISPAVGGNAYWIEVPPGEASKSMVQCNSLLDQLLALRLDRKAGIVAFGGGVIGDLAGFVASIYLRGIRLIQIPTTLLSQVDSSVGGKTGVNHASGKNLIGSFYQPELVWINPHFLPTLPGKEIRSGLAEVVKYGVIRDPKLFSTVEEKVSTICNTRGEYALGDKLWTELILHACRIKATVVSADEKESGLREILNFGHTVGHAIEALSGYGTYAHGEAVAIGMCMAARIAVTMGVLGDNSIATRLEKLLMALGFTFTLPHHTDAEWESVLMMDKKVRYSELRMVLPTQLGDVIVRPVPMHRVLEAIQGWSKEF
ncbi:MAG: 3-dehydroquinate synthase [Candidatus Margulisiibacteriota bacterium]